MRDGAPRDAISQRTSDPDGPDAVDATATGGGWLLPPLAVRGIGWLASRLMRGAARWPGFAASHARAREAGAALVVRACDCAGVAAALGGRVVIVLPPDRGFDPLAGLVASLGAEISRADTSPGGDLSSVGDGRVPVVGLAPERGEFAVGLLAAAGMSALPLTVRHEGYRATLAAGFATPVILPLGRARAEPHTLVAPPDGAAGRARLAEALERALDDTGTAVPADFHGSARAKQPIALGAYALAMSVLAPLARPYLRARLRRGKEDAGRLGERLGLASAPRPPGRLIWIHAASVGESVSILPLAEAMIRRGFCRTVLLTTGTVTSARVVAGRLTPGAIHQFVPLDAPVFARRFLDHWAPDAAILIESELWPNLMAGAHRRDIPLVIVNARMSGRSYARWGSWPGSARAVVGMVRLALAQTPADARRLAVLGAANVGHVGNLKFDCPPPPVDAEELSALERAMAPRPLWLAASTHPGEEIAIAEAHIAVRDRFPDLLTIIAPRHPERGPEIAEELESRWLVPARRAVGQAIDAKTDIYVADTIGELGLFYRLSPVAFVGGSLAGIGGHNPIEPALLDCAILHGPEVHNFRDMYEAFDAAGGAAEVSGSAGLASQLVDLLRNEARVREMVAANQAEIARNAGSLERTLAALAPVLSHSTPV